MAMVVGRPVPRLGAPRERRVCDNLLVSPSGLLHMGNGRERVTATALVLERTRCGRWIVARVFDPGSRPMCPKCFEAV